MSHIHIPDGILPFYLWVPAYLITFFIIFLVIKRMDKEQVKRVLPFTGIAAALMLIAMSVPLVIVPVHLSLAVLTGILIGPKMAFLVVFVVSVILATFGHGGITIVGINTLVIGSEVLVGSTLFRFLGKKHLTTGVIISVVVAVLVSMTMTIGIIGGAVGFEEVLPHTPHSHDENNVGNHNQETHQEREHIDEVVEQVNYLVFSGWMAVILILVVGIALEAVISLLIVRFFSKVKPDLLDTIHGFVQS